VINRDLTIENMLTIVYELNLTQDEYDILQKNKKQHPLRSSRSWLKMKIEDQGQEIFKLKKQVRELELKLNEDRQIKEITNLKSQIKDLKSQLKNSSVEFIENNGKLIPCYFN
jgi:predicted RNase H-like nuclease (RuvC/YqgF family)